MNTSKQNRSRAIDTLWDDLLPLARACGSRDQGIVAHWLRNAADFLDLERKSKDLAVPASRRLNALRSAARSSSADDAADLVLFVLRGCVVTGDGDDCVSALDLFLAYHAFCQRAGLSPLDRRTFYRRMPALALRDWTAEHGRPGRFVHAKSNGLSVYRGIRIDGLAVVGGG